MRRFRDTKHHVSKVKYSVIWVQINLNGICYLHSTESIVTKESYTDVMENITL